MVGLESACDMSLYLTLRVRAGGELALAIGLLFPYTETMRKAIVSVHENQKKRKPGRPATGVDPAVTTRLPVEVLARVEKWAAANGYQRSQAVARLVELGLESEAAGKPAAEPASASKPAPGTKAASSKKTRPRHS
jgi:hypothetical protein